jgi:hypothetical protein
MLTTNYSYAAISERLSQPAGRVEVRDTQRGRLAQEGSWVLHGVLRVVSACPSRQVTAG